MNRRLAIFLAILPFLAIACESMTPEERSAATQFALESARMYRDKKLAPKPAKVSAQK